MTTVNILVFKLRKLNQDSLGHVMIDLLFILCYTSGENKMEFFYEGGNILV